MAGSLAAVRCTRKTGKEPFRNGDVPLEFDLLSFWQWYSSDLISNTTRGVLAEYLVARAVGRATDGAREEWLRSTCARRLG